MRILDRYIIKHISSGYLFILLVFVGLYFIIDIFSNLSDILESKTPLAIIIQYYLYSLPLIILRVSPFSLLIGTLYTFGELNKNNEIVSFRSAGLSLLRIASPVILFALLISIIAFFIQEKILIYSQKEVENIKLHFIKKSEFITTEEKNLAFTSENMIFFAEKFIPKEKRLYRVIIFQEDEDRNINKKIFCENIIYQYGFWIAKNVISYNLDKDGNIVDTPINIGVKKIKLKEKPEELIFKKSIFAQFYSLNNLKKEINRLAKVKAKNLLVTLTIDYYQKMAEPFSHFFLVIGVLPLALEIKRRKVTLASLGVGLSFGFIYYTFSSFSIALGKSGVILPFLSAWVTPLFFLTVGITGLFLIK